MQIELPVDKDLLNKVLRQVAQGHSGMQQALTYGDILDVPFVYSSNGDAFLEHDHTKSSGRLEKEIKLNAFPSPERRKTRIYTNRFHLISLI